MRNPGDIVFTTADIQRWQKHFRLLDNWTIEYCEDDMRLYPDVSWHNGECVVNTSMRWASIYPGPASVDLDEYLFHELLHVAMKCVVDRETEEAFVQDVCRLAAVAGLDWGDKVTGDQA